MKLFNQARYMGRMYREGAGDDGAGDGDDNGDDGPTVAELQASIVKMQESQTALTQENERLTSKIGEANKHNKESERKAREADRKAAEAAGNFEELYASSEKERGVLQAAHDDLRGTIHKKEVAAAAMSIATALAEGENVALLAEFVGKRLKYADDGIKVTDNAGNLTVSGLDDLKAEFKGSARFAALIKGNQSSGGGAAGGSSGGGASKTMARSEFDTLDAVARSTFMKAGGKLTNN